MVIGLLEAVHDWTKQTSPDPKKPIPDPTPCFGAAEDQVSRTGTVAERHFLLLHGWLRSSNCGTARGVEEFLQEALALWGQRQKIRLLRADSGFFEDQLLSFLEQRRLPYIVVARLTKWAKREAQHIQEWRALDGDFAAGEFRLKLHGWEVERRFVVI